MSVTLMNLVFEMPLPHVQKLVLLSLADRANDAGTECYYAVSTIVRRTSLSERTVRKTIGDLASAGHISVYERQGHSSNYVLHLSPQGPPAGPSQQRLPLQGVHPLKARTPARGAPLKAVDNPVDSETAPLHGVHPTPAAAAPHPCTACTPTPARAAPNPSDDPSEDTSLNLQNPPTPLQGADCGQVSNARKARAYRQASAAAWEHACRVIDGVRGTPGSTWDDAREPLGDPRIETAIAASGGYKAIAARDQFTRGDLKRAFRDRFEQCLASPASDLHSMALAATKAMRG